MALKEAKTYCNTLKCNIHTLQHIVPQYKHTGSHWFSFEQTATQCNTLQHIVHVLVLNATHCIRVQHTATNCNTLVTTNQSRPSSQGNKESRDPHRDTLQHNATLCNTLQHPAKQYESIGSHWNNFKTLQHAANHCYTLQHTSYDKSISTQQLQQ